MIRIKGVYAKLETTNPSGSIKDRMAKYIIEKAEKRGELKPGSKIIELTTGNTGIAFSMISAVKGYKFMAVMPESVSTERRKMMEAFGAKVVLTPAKKGMPGALDVFRKIVKKNPDAWLPKQFENEDNIKAYEKTLGKEIIRQFNGKVDAFVAGIGTGGTLIGVAKALKKASSQAKIFGVEPAESAVLSNGKAGKHEIQGIGEGFVPKLINENLNLIDGIITVKSKSAVAMTKRLAKKYGILVGISSGANFLAALKLKSKYKTITTVFPDRGERYLSIL